MHVNLIQKYERLQFEYMIARNSTSETLPIFSVDLMEWPNVISNFKSSTRICGFSNAENQTRLQKCLHELPEK